MPEVYSRALNKSIHTDRFIGHIRKGEEGPTTIFTGGIHGNEPAGVFALHNVMHELCEDSVPVRGNVYALAGNLWALGQGKRYHKVDLNRLWTDERMRKFFGDEIQESNRDLEEQKELYGIIQKILTEESSPFYFMDLHTTSSKTIPFLTVNDSLLNRKFTEQYPVPMILGIEEFLDGPILSYINELGYVAFGFEGGQHDSTEAIKNHEAFIYLSLVYAGNVKQTDVDYQDHYQRLKENSGSLRQVYEIYDRFEIGENESFKMKSGYKNFQKVNKGETLAENNGQPVVMEKPARIFMPLYQCQGDDGFFSIRKIPGFFLKLSAVVRMLGLDGLLPLLPGVHWASDKKDALKVNLKVARFFTRDFFHLMGYRSKEAGEKYLLAKNREAASRDAEYHKAAWY